MFLGEAKVDGYRFCYFKFYYRILRQRRRSIQKKDSNGIMDIDNVNNLQAQIDSNKEELNYAIGLIEYGLNIDNNNPELLDTYGWINYKLENYNLALEYVNKSLSIERDGCASSGLSIVCKNSVLSVGRTLDTSTFLI